MEWDGIFKAGLNFENLHIDSSVLIIITNTL